MSLQARKLRNSLDKSRIEILKPHQNFIKSINKQSKDYENKLLDIEKKLSDKILVWLENPTESETFSLNVCEGSLLKKARKCFEIENFDLIDRKYLMLDEKKIEACIKNGIESIEGIKIYSKSEIDLRLKNV